MGWDFFSTRDGSDRVVVVVVVVVVVGSCTSLQNELAKQANWRNVVGSALFCSRWRSRSTRSAATNSMVVRAIDCSRCGVNPAFPHPADPETKPRARLPRAYALLCAHLAYARAHVRRLSALFTLCVMRKVVAACCSFQLPPRSEFDVSKPWRRAFFRSYTQWPT
ncbi:LANO_0F13168g1_1 [Lachancea nothofagi CBS 11611]|uniref:LANO_0F13168g1_1 n=1 Tax=Lachancea nothofagi CBS 11611 TaxID=1266666 RepID=A0A1G4KBS7_9SACH|nr:LANO_0F13168g1_1 [Lachancea nothofagi CBS 11611]